VTDDDTNDDHAMGFPVPGHVLASLLGEHEDQHRMVAQTIETEVFHFLDSLTVPQLMELRRILNAGPPSPTNNYIDGQAVTVLRLAHRVDHVSGESYEGTLLSPPDSGQAVT
jgi:hypothetical protein